MNLIVPLVLVLIAAATSISSVAATEYRGLNVTWRVPIGARMDEAGSLPTASDGTNYYVIDQRGVIFAFRASDGALQWSNPGNSSLTTLKIHPQAPNSLFAHSYYKHCFIVIDTATGATRFALVNDKPEEHRYRVTPVGRSKFAVTDNTYLSLLDLNGNTIWKRSATAYPGTSGWIFASTSSETMIALVWQNITNHSTPILLRSYEVLTGNPLCDIPHAFPYLWDQLPFEILPNNLLVQSYSRTNPGTLRTAVWDLLSCTSFQTPFIGNVLNDPLYSAALLNPAESDKLYSVNFTVSGDAFHLMKSAVGENNTEWNTLITGSSFTISPAPILFGNVVGQANLKTLNFEGQLYAFDARDGSIQWSLGTTNSTGRIPTAPSTNNQMVFPVGTDMVLIPNLVGYIIFNTATATVVEKEMVQATTRFESYPSSAGGALVVFTDLNTGDVIGARV